MLYVLCAKGVRADGYLSITHFTACATVHNGGRRHLRMGGGGGGGQLFACVRKHAHARGVLGYAPQENFAN